MNVGTYINKNIQLFVADEEHFIFIFNEKSTHLNTENKM